MILKVEHFSNMTVIYWDNYIPDFKPEKRYKEREEFVNFFHKLIEDCEISHIVIDMHNTIHISGEEIGGLLEVISFLKEHTISLKISANWDFKRIVDILEVQDFFEIYDNNEKAFNSITQKKFTDSNNDNIINP